MIFVDQAVGSRELLPIIQRIGVKAELTSLPFGDFCLEGKGPNGSLQVGIERKTLHDMMTCIDDARYAGHQRPGMRQLYDVSLLIVEGHWKPHEPQGVLMEGFHGGMSWGYFRSRNGKAAYSKLYRYLLSVSLTGVLVTYSRDMWQTAYNVCEIYHYFQKDWDKHTSMKDMHRLNVPSLNFKPSLTRQWAASLPGIGVKLSEFAERQFRKPIRLAEADESEWLRVPGVGVKTAQQIYREIHGLR